MAKKRVYQLIKQEGQIIGDHVVGRGPDQRTYVSGDCIESDRDLIAEHPGKFVYAPPGAYDKFEGADLNNVPGSPIVGLPSRRTPSPKGPEEGGNTRAEIEEVAQAIESGDHEYKHRADPEAPLQSPKKKAKNVKIAPIAKVLNPIDRPARDEDDEDEEDDDLVDVADDDDDEEEAPAPKKTVVKKKSGIKKKGITVKKKPSKPADDEDE